MARKLKTILVNRVDLVDAGSNPDADIVLFKRKAEPKQQEERTVPIDLTKLTPDEVAYVQDLEKRVAEIVVPEPTEEELIKSLPEAARKLVEKAKEELAKAETEKADALQKAQDEEEKRIVAEFTKRAKEEFAHLPGTDEEKAKLVRQFNDNPAVMAIFKAAEESLAKTMQPVGDDAATTFGSAFEEVQKKAKDLMKSDATLTLAKAIDKVLSIEPDLYTKHKQGE